MGYKWQTNRCRCLWVVSYRSGPSHCTQWQTCCCCRQQDIACLLNSHGGIWLFCEDSSSMDGELPVGKTQESIWTVGSGLAVHGFVLELSPNLQYYLSWHYAILFRLHIILSRQKWKVRIEHLKSSQGHFPVISIRRTQRKGHLSVQSRNAKSIRR